MKVSFNGYSFAFSVLTVENRYEAAGAELTPTADGLIARATALTAGEGAAAAPGLLEVRLAAGDRRLSWQARAAHSEPIKGIMASIEPLPAGTVMIPPATALTVEEGRPGRCFVYPGGYYPLRHVSATGVEPGSGPLPTWAAQFLLLRAEGRTLCLQAREYPPRVKKLWLYRRGGHLALRLYTEADACRRSSEYSAPTWTLEEVDEWRRAVDDYAAWMADAFGLRPFTERADVQPWLRDIGLVVVLHGRSHYGTIRHSYADMARRLEELATLFPPQRTLVKLVGFEGPIDRRWPDNDPDPALGGPEGFQRFMAAARHYGYHVMPHLNVWGASFRNPATSDLLAFQVQDGEGRPLSWSFDYDHDEVAEEIFAYISPDAPEWRTVLRERIQRLVDGFGVDTIFLDQTGTFVNDHRYDHFRGLKALYSELRAAMPGVQFTGEGPGTEVSVSLCPLLSGVTGASGGDEALEMYRRLFGPFVREHGHSGSLAPEPYSGVWTARPEGWWTAERFQAQEAHAARMGAIPTLNLTDRRISLEGAGVQSVLARARAKL